jgi:hypothetical protein
MSEAMSEAAKRRADVKKKRAERKAKSLGSKVCPRMASSPWPRSRSSLCVSRGQGDEVAAEGAEDDVLNGEDEETIETSKPRAANSTAAAAGAKPISAVQREMEKVGGCR